MANMQDIKQEVIVEVGKYYTTTNGRFKGQTARAEYSFSDIMVGLNFLSEKDYISPEFNEMNLRRATAAEELEWRRNYDA